jgi:hypothetical protein
MKSLFVDKASVALIGRVTGTKLGYARFLFIYVDSAVGDKRYTFWIYQAKWAMVCNETEIIASDSAKGIFQNNLHRIDDLHGHALIAIRVLNPTEVHLDFTGGMRIEVWREDAQESYTSDMITMSKGEEHIAHFPDDVPGTQC